MLLGMLISQLSFDLLAKARFRRRSPHVPNLADELSTARERCLNQFGTAKGLSSTESVELSSNLT